MPLLPFFSRSPDETLLCYDCQFRPQNHAAVQRYMSASTGQCRRLRVQAVNPTPRTNQVRITDGSSRSSKLAVWLLRHPPTSFKVIFPWIRNFIWFLLLLMWPADAFDEPVYNGQYPQYRMGYWGQMWAARSSKEYSTYTRDIIGYEMPVPTGYEVSLKRVTHALHPRRLAIHGSDGWYFCEDRNTIINHPYIAISYRQSDVFQRGTDDEGMKREQEQKARFIEMVRATVLECGMDAYWLDLECLGETAEEKNIDLYRMADIYRGGSFTLIVLRESEDEFSLESWRSWGGRVWTMPEAILSRQLRYKIGFNGPVVPLTLSELANRAYDSYDEETAIINAYSGRDPLERLERLSLLKAAIWRRGSAALPQNKERENTVFYDKDVPPPLIVQQHGYAYPAERVYALMGFFEHRIIPNQLETELQALARLSMANDNDRIAERMVSMLPYRIHPESCWYADDDQYGSQLWDIEPEIQVAGITKRGALVIDGCYAATIRWKDFPDLAFETTDSIRRFLAGKIPYIFSTLLISGIPVVPFNLPGGIALLGCAVLLMCISPFLIAYSNSGRILSSQPWLIGVKGVITAEDVADHLYGGTLSQAPRVSYTPSGSTFARPGEDVVREGHDCQVNLAMDPRLRDDIYTLIDTLSGTIYYFVARRPPTVCLFTGREGGLGRFVLCSETCDINELHKETVLRMPSYIFRSMTPCDWVAIGGLNTKDIGIDS